MQTAYGLLSYFHYFWGWMVSAINLPIPTRLLCLFLTVGFGLSAQTTSTPIGEVYFHQNEDPNCDFDADYCGNVDITVTTNQGYSCTTTSVSTPFQIGEDEHNWSCDEITTNGTAIFTLQASRDGAWTNGVTVLDLLTIQKHILGTNPITNPFYLIAADASNSSGITVLDITLIRQVLLALSESWPAGSWRFVPRFFLEQNTDFCTAIYNNPFNLASTNPFLAQYDYLGYANGIVIVAVPEGFSLPANWYDFYGLKVGDVNGSGSDATLWSDPVEERTFLATEIVEDESLEANTAMISVLASTANQVEGFQMNFKLDPSIFEVQELVPNTALNLDNFDYSIHEDGTIRVLWTDPLQTDRLKGMDQELFQVKAALKQDIKVGQEGLLDMRDEVLPTAFFNTDGDIEFTEIDLIITKGAGGNQKASAAMIPNPVQANTILQLDLPESGNCTNTAFR